MSPFRFNEKYLSQIPALQVLMNPGFTHSAAGGENAGPSTSSGQTEGDD